MIIDLAVGIEGVEGIAVEVQFGTPGEAQRSANSPFCPNNPLIFYPDIVQIKVQVGEKQATMEPQRPKNDAVIEFALKLIDRIFEKDVSGVDIVGNVVLEEGWQVVSQGCQDGFVVNGDRHIEGGILKVVIGLGGPWP